jgi:DNA-binding CsgD family transcriptional regulator
MAEHGNEVRLSPSVTRRLLIVDGKTAVVPINPEETSVGALCVREPGLIDQLTTLFELIWTDAVPLGMSATAGSPSGLSPTDRHLLRLLADGLTDDAAAKRLGISARTVRRIMADLMDRLNAESRFEAGVEAALPGWL